MDGNGSLLASSVAALAMSGLATLPAVRALAGQIRHRTPKDHFYQDKDGSSTPETVAAFSNKVSKAAILALSVLALASSVAAAALITVDSSRPGLVLESWLVAGSWAVVLLQAILLAAHRSPVQAHNLGLWAFFSCLVTLAATSFQAVDAGRRARAFDDASFILRLVNVCIAFGLLFACLSIPRRPRIFFRGKPVDDEWTVSAINRLTWTWAGALLKTARGKGDLDTRDIAQPDHFIRAQNLVAAWPDASLQGKLLRSIFRAYGWRLALQWVITIGRCALGIMPFWAMLRLVQRLEKKNSGEFSATDLWLVLFMGICTMAEQWIDGWVVWYAITRLCIPARGQLSALVFEKSLRRKNVRAAGKPEDEAADDDKDGDDKADDSDSAHESSVTKSRQTIVNLVGVDSKHISDFLMIQFYIINSVGKLFIYSAFLVRLIGWLPYGAGILAWALVLPINTWVSKLYIKAEDGLMKTRDGKLAVVNEALLGMRQIKFSALESQWEAKILKMRETELGKIRRVFAADTVLFFCWVASPILLAAASLAVYASVHGILSPSVAFVSVGIFKSLEVSLSALPELLASGLDTLVSIRRIETYLSGPEMKQTLSEGVDVSFDHATIAWPVDAEVADEDRFILRDVDLTFPAGELSVISGKTGSGKSLLLNALIGEADLLRGAIYMPRTTPPLERNDGKAHPGNWILSGSVAYVGQSPWLESASFRDNILFGLPLLEDRYDRVLDACALKRDLEILTDGDQTELGANGVNLSGGQKWRVTLARAIYSRAEILVMDDIFSAVDAHVGRHIFEKCIAGDICRGRTRILVTHHVTLVQPQTKYLVELGDGTVSHHGLLSELAEDTLQKIKSHEQTETETAGKKRTKSLAMVEPGPTSASDPPEGETSMDVAPTVPPKAGKQFIVDEAREKGMVKRHVYATYMRSSGGTFFWIVCALLYAAFEAGNLGRNWWLQKWTDDTQTQGAAADEHGMAYGLSLQHSTQHAPLPTSVSRDARKPLSFYLGVYVALAAASGIIGTLRFLWSFVMSIRASKALFEKILYAVLRTKLRWIDTVPVGRILNRLTADFDIIDNRLTVDFGFLFWRMLGLLGIIVAAILVSTSILPLAAILIFIAALVGKRFMEGARPVKRLESTAKSPVFELFNATLAGVSLLRAFHKTGVYVERMYDLLDSWDSLSINVWLLNRWLGFRMALLGTLFTTLVGLIVVGSPLVDAAMAGFTLSFALDFSGNMLMAIRGYASLELDMNAAERVVEYTEVETEDQGGDDPPAAWPTTGRVQVQDLVAGYAADLPPVLKGISFDIANNERVGVIGRTGAGKSSLTLALFRFIEARSGSVLIDGLDISDISLRSLRSRLAIIPQDPVLFSGTVRSNLDPFNQHTDDELRDSLSRVHLIDSEPGTPSHESAGSGSDAAPQNANIFRDLYSGISESGGNLSQGQRQLLCIARAIVSRPKIMVLDEATSAVDMATDALIQRSIREQFGDSTLIVIAHRLSTIADFDRILVLADGRVVEFGSPKELWHRPGGLFRAMCDHSGERERLSEVITGRGS
ncbi:hypothetical protein XA68_17841 [Ophiocordyceps unilateralis]|uniref:ABC transporter domain-containing protein n=1 Tax=Ophiocordyceps unilateralis TaxID=268505 RepID=A0A2A9PIU3_OPHUN|nr:hypothetical protein XA68_17841 [Ophiocordyceps unilateralis]